MNKLNRRRINLLPILTTCFRSDMQMHDETIIDRRFSSELMVKSEVSWSGGVAEGWSGGTMEWWNGGVVERWSGGTVEWWSGGAVEWSGGVVERWGGGAVERCMGWSGVLVERRSCVGVVSADYCMPDNK